MLGTAANAHPHVFVDVRGSFVLDSQKRLEAIRIHWLYDPFTTLMVTETLGLDPDGDGQLDDADLQTLIEGETDWAPEYEGDTYLYIDGTKVALSRPHDAWAEAPGDQVGVGFTLTLDEPVEMAGRTATMKLYDPSYYYAYSVTAQSKVEGPAEACDFEIIPFDPDDAAEQLLSRLSALSREEFPDDPEVGAQLAETLTLSCP